MADAVIDKFIPKVYEVCPVVGWVLFHFLADGKTDRFSKTKSVKKWAAITLKTHGGAHCSDLRCWKCPQLWQGRENDVFSPLPKLWALPTAEVGAMGAVVSSRHLRNG